MPARPTQVVESAGLAAKQGLATQFRLGVIVAPHKNTVKPLPLWT